MILGPPTSIGGLSPRKGLNARRRAQREGGRGAQEEREDQRQRLSRGSQVGVATSGILRSTNRNLSLHFEAAALEKRDLSAEEEHPRLILEKKERRDPSLPFRPAAWIYFGTYAPRGRGVPAWRPLTARLRLSRFKVGVF